MLLNLTLVLTLATTGLSVSPVAALTLPWQQRALDDQPAAARGTGISLQEVSPPEAVQQLQSALSGRQPVLEILSPQDDTVLPAGPWRLKLRVHDWPLVDGGALGAGPHLAVQLDQEPPRIWTGSEGVMPELSPGSHRLTVYAALPWGEARKDPGAVQQIRLHRTAPNPLSLPLAHSPQLLAVSPSGPVSAEPLLLDWLLLDAPLQDVGGSGTQWRLRVTINGEDVVLDQQSPLWLQGWKPGLNALRLELLDARGAPLNPPFNSLVQEVDLRPTAAVPRWRGAKLSAAELAILLGEAPPGLPSDQRLPMAASTPERTLPSAAASSRVPAVSTTNAAAQAPTAPASSDDGVTPSHASDGSIAGLPSDDREIATRLPEAAQPLRAVQASTPPAPDAAPAPASPGRLGPDGMKEISQDSAPPPAPARLGSATQSEATSAVEPAEERQPASGGEANGNDGPTSSTAPIPGEQAAATRLAADDSAAEPQGLTVSPQPAPLAMTGEPEADRPAPQTLEGTSAPSLDPYQPTMPPTIATSPATPSPTPPSPQDSLEDEPIHPSSALTGRARDLVNDDGTLRRPERSGPLASLRERLQR